MPYPKVDPKVNITFITASLFYKKTAKIMPTWYV